MRIDSIIFWLINKQKYKNMDSAFGICGRDWVIVCTDTSVNRSIFTLKHDDDKIIQLNQFKVLATTGE